ncbi:MAG: hypothetical protein EXR72_06080 [Myxococcales bacterium]|nr:hypothetical protein [Myxococcales bacterium]
MANVKTAISLDPRLYKEASATARKLRLSRSGLIAVALDEYLRRLHQRDLSARIDAASAGGLDEHEKRAAGAARKSIKARSKGESW